MKSITKKALPRTKTSHGDFKNYNFDTNRKLDRKDVIEALRKFEEVSISSNNISVGISNVHKL